MSRCALRIAANSIAWQIRKITRGVVGLVAARAAATLEDILEAANKSAGRGEKGLIVLLDGVEDPHNLGAIIRTALAAGAHGVVIPERRAAGLTDTVARASAGAIAHLPVAKVTNLARTMEELKEAGYWLVGLDERADKNYTRGGLQLADRDRPGRRRPGAARTHPQALRLRRLAADNGPGQVAECFGRRRSGLV